jgi:drug/metabolite transporter (DMT)-like permease
MVTVMVVRVASVLTDWRGRFAVLTAIWGTSFLLIKVALGSFAPIQVALGRLVLGALVLLAVLAARRERLPKSPLLWGHLAVAAMLNNALPFVLFAYAEQHISSAMAAICNATTPLFTLLIAMFALAEERPTRARTIGLGLGFLGTLIVLGSWGTASGDFVGASLALGAAVSYGFGGVYMRRYLTGAGHSSVVLSAGQILAGALQLAVIAPFLAPLPAAVSIESALALAALGALGTGAAYVLQYSLVRDVGATATSTVTYFIPIVSILIGMLVLGEQLSWNAPVGALVIIAGALLAQRGLRMRARLIAR